MWVRKLFFSVLMLQLFSAVQAQTVKGRKGNEVGLMLGGSYYTGDLNPTRHFKYTRPAAGLFLRHCFNPRFALRIHGNYGTIMGDDATAEYAFRKNRNLSFKSRIIEIGTVLEFNFLPYEIGDPVERFTPYVFGGFNYFKFNPKTTLDGQKYTLHDFGTEGQGVNGKRNYILTQPSIPFGLGLKFNLFNNFGISAEWGLRRTFTDYLDDVSGTYPDPTELREGVSGQLSDRTIDNPEGLRSNIGRQRGIPKTKDWYVFTGICLAFRIVPKDINCKL